MLNAGQTTAATPRGSPRIAPILILASAFVVMPSFSYALAHSQDQLSAWLRLHRLLR